MAQSRWQDIYEHLQTNAFEVYSPGIKTGECERPYLVVKNNGSNRHTNNISTNDDLYCVMCYVPQNEYSTLEVYVQSVLKEMKGLEPMILPNGNQTPSFYDAAVSAHMISITYKNYKKMY